jgi:hypothetical protein
MNINTDSFKKIKIPSFFGFIIIFSVLYFGIIKDFILPQSKPEVLSEISDNTSLGDITKIPVTPDFKIINPKVGETINTLRPEFFGSGHPDSTLTIKIDDEDEQSLYISSDNKWSFVPTSDISPGLHTLTANNGTDAPTLEFVITNNPKNSDLAMVASPSATIILSSPTPTIEVVETPDTSETITPTPSTLLKTGNSTPTIIIAVISFFVIITATLITRI